MKKRARCKDGSLNMNYRENKGLDKYGDYPDFYDPNDLPNKGPFFANQQKPNQKPDQRQNPEESSKLDRVIKELSEVKEKSI